MASEAQEDLKIRNELSRTVNIVVVFDVSSHFHYEVRNECVIGFIGSFLDGACGLLNP